MRRTKTSLVSVGGVLAAGALVLLWLACMAPSGQLGLTAAGGLFPMAAAVAAGRGAGYLCWGAAGLLGLILLPDKGVALLFLLFLLDLLHGAERYYGARRVGDLLDEAGGHAVFHAGVVDAGHQGVVGRPRDGDKEEPPLLVDSARHPRDPRTGLDAPVQQVNEL